MKISELPEATVSIVIVNYNGRHFIDNCLKSLMNQTCELLEIILVDNGSQDGSVEFTKQEYPSVKIIQNNYNMGLVAAYNQGIKKSKGNLIILANNDIIVERTCVEHLVWVITSSQNIGISGVRQVSYQKPENTSCFPVKFLPSYKLPWTSIWLNLDQNITSAIDTDILGDCFMMIKREVIQKVGLLNERYYLYLSEDDICLNTRRAGYTLKYVPLAIVRHFAGGATGRLGTRKFILFLKGWLEFRIRNIHPLHMLPALIFTIIFQLIKYSFSFMGHPLFFPLPQDNIGEPYIYQKRIKEQ